MLWTVIVILLVLWLLGAFGIPGRIQPWGGGSNWVHVLLILVIILLLLQFI